MSDLTALHFHDATKAREYLEALRWPDGPICPFCGEIGKAYATKKVGVYRCAAKECRKDFSVTVGTIFERSHIPLDKWLLAFRLMAGSKKGMSANQMHRQLGVTYKTAWFMEHRIREAMDGIDQRPLGGEGKIIEADETYIGKVRSFPYREGWHIRRSNVKEHKIVALVERKGRARAIKMDRLKGYDVKRILAENADPQSRLMTDDAKHYIVPGREFAAHETVNHSAHEYGRGEVSTNTIEGFFSIFKRGMKGVYQHCGEQHLRRYLAEFCFRYSNRSALGVDDAERTRIALRGAEGKRLLYAQAGSH